ncbi:MAG: aspartate aminotransferase family protein [Nitrososphaerota archaeon]|nr:aspartate aminotransferase family protein [Nitrososphaerota archaeon]
MGDSKILTAPPGPKARKLIERELKLMHQPSIDRVYPIFTKTIDGAVVEDVDGNRYLDFAIGSGSMSLGGAPEVLVNTITERAKELGHGSYPYLNPAVIEFAEKLSSVAPGDSRKMVAMLSTGSEAADFAFRVGRGFKRKPQFISFIGGHHGFSLGALALSGHYAAMFRNHPHLVPGVTHTPYAYCYRCPFKLEYPSCGMACADYIEETLLTTISPPENTAGLIVEPIQGPAGIIPPPSGWLQKVYDICKRNGILYIDDEVFAGLGRTGRMFAIEADPGIDPDMMVIGKTLGGGLIPMSAVLMKEEVALSIEPGATSSTLHGYPLGAAVATKVIETIQGNGLLARNAKEGEYLMKRCLELQEKHPWIGDVRGKGLMIGLEFVKDRKTKEPLRKEVRDIAWRSVQKGLIFEWFGLKGNVIKLYPNYFVTREQLDEGLDILDAAITDVEKGHKSPTDFDPAYVVSAGWM